MSTRSIIVELRFEEFILLYFYFIFFCSLCWDWDYGGFAQCSIVGSNPQQNSFGVRRRREDSQSSPPLRSSRLHSNDLHVKLVAEMYSLSFTPEKKNKEKIRLVKVETETYTLYCSEGYT